MGIIDYLNKREKDKYMKEYYEEMQKEKSEAIMKEKESAYSKEKTHVKDESAIKTADVPDVEVKREPVTSPIDFIIDEKYYEEDLKGTRDWAWGKSYFTKPKIIIPKKDVVILVLENTPIVNNYKSELYSLVTRIVESNKDSLFLFLKIGSDKKFYDVIDYSSIKDEKTLDNLLSLSESYECKIDLLEALNHIKNFLENEHISAEGFEYKWRKYDIQNNSIVFIGTATFDLEENSKKEMIKVLSSIKLKAKKIKYFCMEDNQTAQAAMLGFPIIGHIESDFYK